MKIGAPYFGLPKTLQSNKTYPKAATFTTNYFKQFSFLENFFKNENP